jgi:4-alpha-glucanotransferase
VWRNRIGQTMPRADGLDPVEAAMAERAEDRALLWSAFQQAGVAAKDVPAPPPESAPVDEALAFVAATPMPLVTYPLEDLLALEDQPNLPGSIDEHPNWRRRLALPVDDLFAEPAFCDRLLAVERARSASVPGTASATATASTTASTGADTP